MFIKLELGGTGTGCLFQFTYCDIGFSFILLTVNLFRHSTLIEHRLLLTEQVFYGDLVYKFEIIVGKPNFSSSTRDQI